MLSVIIKRNAEPTVIQMTQEAVMRELATLNNSEMLLEDTWLAGLRKVRTPYVCLLEADCTLSASYIASNVGLMRKTTQSPKGGGYNKLAMIASCLGVSTYANRIYNYQLEKVKDRNLSFFAVEPRRDKPGLKPYHAQVGFVPGAIIRMPAIKREIDSLPWDTKNLVELSTIVSFHFWGSGRRVQVNPNTTYVSNMTYLEHPLPFKFDISAGAANLFQREGI